MAENDKDAENCNVVTGVGIMTIANCKKLEEMSSLSLLEHSKARLWQSHSDSSFENEDAKFAACEDRTNQTSVRQLKKQT